MQIKHQDLQEAVNAGILKDNQAEKLWLFLHEKNADVPTFRLADLFYYFGGLLAISAVTLFVTTAWDRIRGVPLFIISLLLIALGFLLMRYFLNKKFNLPAGIMATFSLALVPLAVYNIQIALGQTPPYNMEYNAFHTWISWFWFPMEIITLLVGVILLYFYRFPFLLFPISVVLWYMSMDLWPILSHMQDYSFEDRAQFSMMFGIVMLMIAFYVDLKQTNDRKDYAFWLYIFGVITFWGGLSCQSSDYEINKAIYCLINIVMIFLSVLLNRRVFAVFGAMGVLGYLGHLAFSVFGDSMAFPVVLVFIGILIIFAGMRWTKVEAKLFNVLRPYIPSKILEKNK